MSFKDEKLKGLRPVASVATAMISEEEHFLVCITTRMANLVSNCFILNMISQKAELFEDISKEK